MCLHEKVSVVEKLCILTHVYKLNHALPRSDWTFNALTTPTIISGKTKSVISQIAGISRHHFVLEEDRKKIEVERTGRKK